MSGILNTMAVGKKSGDDAGEILKAYTQTRGLAMVQNHTLETGLAKEPTATGAVDPLPR